MYLRRRTCLGTVGVERWHWPQGHDINNTQAILFDDITKNIVLYLAAGEAAAWSVLFVGTGHGGASTSVVLDGI